MLHILWDTENATLSTHRMFCVSEDLMKIGALRITTESGMRSEIILLDT